jgi:hypothetical protein
VLFGANQGKPVAALDLPKALQELAEQQAFDLQAYKFGAAAEQFRAPRLVKVGLIQNAVVKPTTAPFAEQRQVSKMAKEKSMELQPPSTGPQCSRHGASASSMCCMQLPPLTLGLLQHMHAAAQTCQLLWLNNHSTATVVAACCLQGIYDRVSQLIEAAGQAGVKILCLQEAW